MTGHDQAVDPFAEVDLTRFDEDFAQAPLEEREFEEIPDDKYTVTVDKVELTTAKTSGNTLLKWTLRIEGPRYAGRMLWRNNVLLSKENLRWLKSDLHLCGLDLDRLSELPGRLSELLDVRLEVTKRTKGGSVNLYFNRRLENAPASGSSDGSAQDEPAF